MLASFRGYLRRSRWSCPLHHADRSAFLASLPDRDRDRVLSLGSVDTVSTGTVLHESGRLIREVWFPIDCVASLSTTLEDGAEAEVGIIGFEGLVGVTALLGGTDTTWSETAVQIGGEALRVPLEALRPEVSRSASLRLLLQRFGQALLVQASQTGACNRFHSIEQRLARCLLSLCMIASAGTRSTSRTNDWRPWPRSTTACSAPMRCSS